MTYVGPLHSGSVKTKPREGGDSACCAFPVLSALVTPFLCELTIIQHNEVMIFGYVCCKAKGRIWSPLVCIVINIWQHKFTQRASDLLGLPCWSNSFVAYVIQHPNCREEKFFIARKEQVTAFPMAQSLDSCKTEVGLAVIGAWKSYWQPGDPL